MKEIISINIGEPGLRIGDQTLSLYLQEHQPTERKQSTTGV